MVSDVNETWLAYLDFCARFPLTLKLRRFNAEDLSAWLEDCHAETIVRAELASSAFTLMEPEYTRMNDRDIVDVIADYVALGGTNGIYKARCPFHQERTPSFTVTQRQQTFHCFGCGLNGNAKDFLDLALRYQLVKKGRQ